MGHINGNISSGGWAILFTLKIKGEKNICKGLRHICGEGAGQRFASYIFLQTLKLKA